MLRRKRAEAVDAARDDNEFSPVERLYAQWVVAHERGEAPSFDEFCAAHPEEAEDLRQRHRGDSRLDSLLRLAGLGSRADAELERHAAANARLELSELGPPTRRYELGARIGSGGMGVVHEARDLLLDRVVAYKRIRDPERAARLLPLFRREMRVAALLDHPGVATVHDAGLDADGSAYYTMPLVRGQDLTEIYRGARDRDPEWSTTRVVGLLLQVAETMAYVHSKGVVHRDLKPHNIRVGRYGEVRVMDWGLARIVEARDEVAGHEAVALGGFVGSMPGRGTPPYMAPEQWREGGLIGPRTDVYALGVMLYELLAGRMPYFETDERQLPPMELVRRMEAGSPASLRLLAPRQPAELVAICERAMAREPEGRYPDCAMLARDLRAYIEQRTVSAYETGAWAETKKFIQRHRVLASIVVAFVVVVAGLALYAVGKADLADEAAKLANHEAAKASANSEEARRNLELAREQEAAARKLAEELAAQKRDLQMRGLILEVERLRAATRDSSQLGNLGKPAYLWWMEAAQALVEGRPGDDKLGQVGKPGLAEVQAKLRELRAPGRARPRTPEEAQADYQSHPERGRLEQLRRGIDAALEGPRREVAAREAEVDWMARMVGDAPWPKRSREEPDEATAAELDALRDMDAGELSRLVLGWCGVDGEPLFGREALALLCAERAVARADERTLAASHEARAWALFRSGLQERSLPDLERALALVDADRKPSLERSANLLREELARWSDERMEERRAELRESRAEATRARERLVALEAERHASLEPELEALEELCRERRTWRFASAEDEWWHRQLSSLESELLRLEDQLEVAREAADGPKARQRWAQAIEGVAKEPKYASARWPASQRVGKQLGLLPLGSDPATGLWEFVHLQTGAEPPMGDDGLHARDAEGRLALAHDTGVVFVLVPGGRVPLQDASGAGGDAQAASLDLAPFFIAKHEMTWAQWSRYAPRVDEIADEQPALPVGDVSWNSIDEGWSRFLGWGGLPTSLQWEHACRAGTSTPWWTGADEGSLRGMENLAFDERPAPARVGSSRANPFGLHDMQGNLWEWCADALVEGRSPRAGDGLQDAPDALARVVRGAGYADRAAQARSDRRTSFHPAQATPQLGWRAAMKVVP